MVVKEMVDNVVKPLNNGHIRGRTHVPCRVSWKWLPSYIESVLGGSTVSGGAKCLKRSKKQGGLFYIIPICNLVVSMFEQSKNVAILHALIE